MQALEASDLDRVVFQAPVLRLQWNDLVDLLQELGNGGLGSCGGIRWTHSGDRP